MKTKVDCGKNSLFSYPFLGKDTSDNSCSHEFKNKISSHYYKKIIINS